MAARTFSRLMALNFRGRRMPLRSGLGRESAGAGVGRIAAIYVVCWGLQLQDGRAKRALWTRADKALRAGAQAEAGGDLDGRLEGIAKGTGSEEDVFSKLRRTRYGGARSQLCGEGTKSGEGCITAAAACTHNARDRPRVDQI